jgi:hypothetical protein
MISFLEIKAHSDTVPWFHEAMSSCFKPTSNTEQIQRMTMYGLGNTAAHRLTACWYLRYLVIVAISHLSIVHDNEIEYVR